jgi:hypothetical protein
MSRYSPRRNFVETVVIASLWGLVAILVWERVQ